MLLLSSEPVGLGRGVGWGVAEKNADGSQVTGTLKINTVFLGFTVYYYCIFCTVTIIIGYSRFSKNVRLCREQYTKQSPKLWKI